MDELYRTLGSAQLLGIPPKVTHSDDLEFEVTEGWLNHETGKVTHITEKRKLDSWLAVRSRVDTESGSESQETLVFRFIKVNVNIKENQIFLEIKSLKALVQEFGLELAYKYAQSCKIGASAIPHSEEQPELRTYALCFAPKLVCVWSHAPHPDRPYDFLTQGLMFVQKDGPKGDKGSKPIGLQSAGRTRAAKEESMLVGVQNAEQKRITKPFTAMGTGKILGRLFALQWDKDLYHTGMIPSMLFSLLLIMSIHATETTVLDRVRVIESLTGHHDFKSIELSHDDVAEATKQFALASADASGCATQLASAARKGKMVEVLLDFMHQQAAGLGVTNGYEGSSQGRRYLEEHVEHLRSRLGALEIEMNYMEKRVEVQISALAGLVSKNDSIANIKLSKAQHELAIHSFRDSTSMKTLAIVTMFFLPGSFVSALLALPMFRWDTVRPGTRGIGVPTTPQFGLYWVITVALTAATFILYYLWLWVQKRQMKARYLRFPTVNRDEVLKGEAEESDELSIIEKGSP